MTADFCLVSHAAQTHADIVSSHCSGDGFCNRGLAHTGRTHQTDDLSFDVWFQLAHCQNLQDSFFHLLQAVVVGIQLLLCLVDVQPLLGHVVPRQREDCIQIVSGHHCLLAVVHHLGKFVDFLSQLLFGFFVGSHLFEFLTVLLDFLVAVLILAQLGMDGFELFPQVVFLLVAVHLLLHPLGNAALDGQNLILPTQQRGENLHAFADARLLQNHLLVLDGKAQILCQIFADVHRVLRTDDVYHQLLGHLGRIVAVFLEQILDHPHIGVDGHLLALLDRQHRKFFAHHLIKRGILDQLAHPCAVLSFHDHPHHFALCLENLFDLCYHTNGVEVVLARVFHPCILLGHQKDFLVALHRLIECQNRLFARHIKMQHHLREHHQPTHCDGWQAQCLHLVYLNLLLGHSNHLSFPGKSFLSDAPIY